MESTQMEMPQPSLRATDWMDFSSQVFNHIEDYTVPQYGDRGVDQMTTDSIADKVHNMKRYLNRMGKNQRGQKDQLMDCLKLAHYAQMCHYQLVQENSDEPTSTESI